MPMVTTTSTSRMKTTISPEVMTAPYLVVFKATTSVFPDTSRICTRSPMCTVSSQMKVHSSAPRSGLEKRTRPRRSPSGSRMTCPTSPSRASRDMPARVLSTMRGFMTRNQKAVSRAENMVQSSSCRVRQRHRSEETALALIKTRRRKTALFFSRRFTMWTAFFITLLIVINPMNSVLCTSISNQEFMLYHTKDVLEVTGIHSDVNWKKELKGSIMKYDEEKNIPYFGIAKSRNLIVIQIESFMNFLINAKYEGQELTPNLNKLIKDHTIYFDNYYQEVSAGNTSDSEFATNNSIYGTINSYTYSIYEDNYFNGLPWLLKAEGYNTNVFHAYNKDFWNREAAYPALGFDKFYSKKYFVNKEKIGMGLSDEEMFKQSLDIMEKQKQPFYDFFITLSNHYPYIMPYDKFDIKLKKHDDNTTFGYYLNSAHYTDYCIGKFIEDLKERGLYDNSIIAMYGDHTGLTKADLIIKRSMDRYLGKEYDYDVMLNIPLLIHIPNTKEDVTQRISVTGGNLDFMPAVAALMGIDKLNTFYLGHNLLYVKKNLVSNQYYMPKGSFIYGDIVYEMAKDGVFEHGRAYNKKTLKKVELEDCFKYYKKSIAILNASEQVLLKDKLRNKYPHNKNK